MIQLQATRTGKKLEVVFEGVFVEIETKVMNVLERAVNPMKQALAKYPNRPAVHPFQFATEKSRRYYFVLVKSGKIKTDGKRYIRTGGYSRSWQVDAIKGKNMYTLAVGNKWKASKFVGGALDFEVAKARARQVAGHRVTGWQLSAQVADAQFERIINEIEGTLR